VASRINRAIELLAAGQAVYYVGAHTGHVLTRAQGREDAHTWADYINVGMEHGAFDMTGLGEYVAGLVDGGPTRSGHRTPAVVVEAPVNGTDEANVRHNAWQFRQILGRGVHGILLCQAETAGAARAFVESCRYPHNLHGVDPRLPSPIERLRGASINGVPEGLGIGTRAARKRPRRRSGASRRLITASAATRGRSTRRAISCSASSSKAPRVWPGARRSWRCRGSALPSWGRAICRWRSATGRCRATTTPPEMREARERVFAACRRNGVAFLEIGTPANITAKLDEGVRVIAGHSEAARLGRAYQKRTLPV
jgi:4-hydroxy-2-oxoheptanedioate aldolase